MCFLKKLSFLSLCLAITVGQALAHDEPQSYFQNNGVRVTWAIALATAAITTGKRGIQAFEQLVARHTRAPKSGPGKDLHKKIWSTSIFATLGLTSTFLISRYAYRGIGDDWARFLSLTTSSDYGKK